MGGIKQIHTCASDFSCKAAYIQIRHISSIWHLLTPQATQTLVCSLVLSRLDYCNSLLAGCPMLAGQTSKSPERSSENCMYSQEIQPYLSYSPNFTQAANSIFMFNIKSQQSASILSLVPPPSISLISFNPTCQLDNYALHLTLVPSSFPA